MRKTALGSILTVAIAGSLVAACGSPDRNFEEGANNTTDASATDADGGKEDSSAPIDQSSGKDTTMPPTNDAASDMRTDTGPDADAPSADAVDVATNDARIDAGMDAATTDSGNADQTQLDATVDLATDDVTIDAVVEAGPDAPPWDGDCSGTPPPTVTPGGNISICPGKPTTLTSSAASTYSWSTGATTQSIDVSAAGSFTVTTTDSRGCAATSAPTVVSTYPAPSTPTITASGATRFCVGGTVTLTANSAAGYLWSTGATTQSIVVNSSGNYTVTTTDVNGCTATSTPVAVTTVTPGTGSKTFAYTGAVETWTVPECVTQVTMNANGAQGGANNFATYPGIGGYGGNIVAKVTVVPASVLQIRVGGAGALCTVSNVGGWNGGGTANCMGYSNSGTMIYSGTGGGATDIRVTPYGINDRILVAGGGGGAGFNCFNGAELGGAGGGQVGGATVPLCATAPYCGQGGTQAAGGVGGMSGTTQWGGSGYAGYGGYGATGCSALEGGGGGGGYYGGGGGFWNSGGGGSDYYRPALATLVSETQGARAGSGSVTFSW
jgi:hypothetical protein